MELLGQLGRTALTTMLDVAPIIAVLAFFQFAAIRRRLANMRRIAVGFIYVVAGLTLFLVGLEEALFPLGRIMAEQLTDPGFLGTAGIEVRWADYLWVYAFGAAIGFSAAIAEPSLLAVALKANQISGGTISVWGLRVIVAAGAGAGVALGTVRIVTGTPLYWYMIVGYAMLILQTWRTTRVARDIVPLAYDSGGVTTSTVTVPLVAALGLGLAAAIPGRDPVIDGFGLIASTALFPMISVLGYAELTAWRTRRLKARWAKAEAVPPTEQEGSRECDSS